VILWIEYRIVTIKPKVNPINSLKKHWTTRESCGKIINAPHEREVLGRPGKTFWTLTTEQ